jgi:hypothetical protein
MSRIQVQYRVNKLVARVYRRLPPSITLVLYTGTRTISIPVSNYEHVPVLVLSAPDHILLVQYCTVLTRTLWIVCVLLPP